MELVVRRIAVRDPQKMRAVSAPGELMTESWRDLVDDPLIQIVVELMGGIDPPSNLILGAIAQGKIVVTGNKALLAEHGREIFEAAAKHKVPVFFEAAAAGGMPIIKAIREAFIGNHILSIHGIINGTSNYILTRMAEAGLGFAEALAEAQAAGYAEADPTLDVNGWDAAHKAIILASLAYGFWVGTGQDLRRGHRENHRRRTSASPRSSATASSSSPSSRPRSSGEIEVRVHPTLIPRDTRARLGERRLQRRRRPAATSSARPSSTGAAPGQDPTSSAVISDLAEAAVALAVAAQRLRLHAARPLRHLQADRRDRLPILPAHLRGR